MSLLEAIGFLIFIGIPWLFGVIDLYMAHRFAKENGTDKSAAFTNWIAWKWACVTQLKHIVKLVPFMSKDLTEIYGIREDDGRTT